VGQDGGQSLRIGEQDFGVRVRGSRADCGFEQAQAEGELAGGEAQRIEPGARHVQLAELGAQVAEFPGARRPDHRRQIVQRQHADSAEHEEVAAAPARDGAADRGRVERAAHVGVDHQRESGFDHMPTALAKVHQRAHADALDDAEPGADHPAGAMRLDRRRAPAVPFEAQAGFDQRCEVGGHAPTATGGISESSKFTGQDAPRSHR
jgi:hypothetical protein